MHDFLLGTTELGKVALAHVGGKDLSTVFRIGGRCARAVRRSVAALFASNHVRSPTRPGKPPVVTWYAAVEGAQFRCGNSTPPNESAFPRISVNVCPRIL